MKRTKEHDDIDSSTTKKRHLPDHHVRLRVDADAEIWQSISLDKLDIKALYQFIRSKGDIAIANSEQYGLLYLAAHHESTEALRILLLQPELEVNERHGPHKELALHAAASAGHFDAVELLVEHGSDVNVIDTNGYLPMTNAIFAKSLPCLRFLLERQSRVDTQDDKENTPLHLAAMVDFPDAIALLVKHGVPLNKSNKRGLSPLAIAIGLGHMQVMQELIDHGADVDGDCRIGKLLHHAITWNRLEAVQALIKGGCQVDALNPLDETPLLVAVQQRKIDLVRFLLDHGADPCASHGGQNAPLLYAANHGYTELCKLLLTPSTSSFFLRRAAQMAERARFPDTAKSLLSVVSERQRTEDDMSSESLPSAVLTDPDFAALINTFSDDESSPAKDM